MIKKLKLLKNTVMSDSDDEELGGDALNLEAETNDTDESLDDPELEAIKTRVKVMEEESGPGTLINHGKLLPQLSQAVEASPL